MAIWNDRDDGTDARRSDARISPARRDANLGGYISTPRLRGESRDHPQRKLSGRLQRGVDPQPYRLAAFGADNQRRHIAHRVGCASGNLCVANC